MKPFSPKVREVISYLAWNESKHMNCFRCNFKTESLEHINKKFERWSFYRKKGYDVFCEADLKQGGTPDLIIVTEYEIWIDEIMVSEKEDNIELKRKVYPFPIKMVKVNGN